MKYSRPFTALFLFTLGAAGAAWAAGCAGGTDADLSGPKASSSSSSGSVGQGGEGGQGGSVGQGGQGGSVSGAGGSGGAGGTSPSCGPAGDLVLAVSSLYIGDKNFNDTKSNTAWKQFGFDIDGKISTGQSNDLCKPRNGALPTTVYPDGNNGIDNSFGKNILPILLVMDANFSDSVNMSITSGALTMLLRFEGLGSGPNMDPVSAKLYTGVNLGSPPELDGTDCWPVRLEDLVNPQDINSTKVVFPTSSLASNVWKSGVTATMLLPLSTSAGPLSLTLHQARLSFTLDPTHTGVMDGQLGGVLDTAEFLAVAKKALGAFDSTLCSGPTSDSILKQIESASDILKDGTQDPAATCDGISIGLGFKASWAGFDSIAPPEKPPVDPCAP